MSSINSASVRRVIERNRRQIRMAEAVGLDPRDVGKIFNRAAPPAQNAPADTNETIPDSPEGLQELLADSARVQRIMQAGQFGEVVKKYASNVLNTQQDIARQVREQVQSTMTEFLRNQQGDVSDDAAAALRARVPLGVNQHGDPRNAEYSRMGLYNKSAMGAPLDREFGSSSEYFRAIWHNTQRTADLQAQLGRVRNAFSSTVPSEGGFLIPEQLRSEILRVSLETAIVRPRARVIPMETLRVPFPAIDSTSNASSVYGGIVAYWTEESAALTDSNASFGRIVLDAKKLTAYTQIPNELIADSPASFQALIDQIFPEALGWYEDDAFLNGNGVGMPLGMINAGNTALVAQAAEGGQAATTIVWENVIKMFSRMLPASMNRAIWIASPNVLPELATMALTVGTGGSAIWLNNGVQGPPAAILGRPLYFSEKVPALGGLGDLNFVDPAYYLIGDRQVMSAMSSPHYRFANDDTAYRIISRLDGQPWLRSAITPKNSGPTLTPFVQLAAR